MDRQEFIAQIAEYVVKYAGQYGIRVHSPIIAQAILESGWGQSSLAVRYHNYFGMKCRSRSDWKGKSVNMATAEEYTPGTYTNIRDNFRVYDSMEDGVKGYFDFINYSRYANLKGVTDPQTYVENIKADGYATSSTYVEKLMRVIRESNLTKYDSAASQVPCKSIEEVAREVIDGKYGNGTARRAALEAAGYNYNEVQAKVDELCGKSPAAQPTNLAPAPTTTKTLYRVQVGAFARIANANAMLARVKAAGFNACIVQEKNLYKVQVGAFSVANNAEKMKAKLKAAGFSAVVKA